MKLYLIQHGKAVSEAVDPARPLSDEGRREIEKVALFLKSLNLAVDLVWHSEKKRAIQTADLLEDAVEVRIARLTRPDINPADDVAKVADELNRIEDDVLIAGHIPFLPNLAGLLLTGDDSANPVAFQNGGVVALHRCESRLWQLDWLITPQLLASSKR